MKVWGTWLAINVVISAIGVYAFREKRYHIRKEEKPYLLIFLLLLFSAFALHMIEIKIDAFITSSISLDFTRKIYDIEGGIASVFQSIQNPLLDYYFAFIYMIGFPFLLYFTPFLYLISRDVKSFKTVVIAYILAVFISLPFMLFFPVHDVWWTSMNYPWYNGRVSFRLMEIWPSSIPILYKFTTINNCFPSMHSALSAQMAYSSIIAGYRKFSIVATIIAISVPLATLYLGIHWLMDIMAGEAIALLSIIASLKVTGFK